MGLKIVFEDGDNNEMDCFLDTQGKVYIGVGESDCQSLYRGNITLDKTDVKKLIDILMDFVKDMED